MKLNLLDYGKISKNNKLIIELLKSLLLKLEEDKLNGRINLINWKF
jgi:hypothetical protein